MYPCRWLNSQIRAGPQGNLTSGVQGWTIPYMEALATGLAPFGIRVNMLTPGGFPSKLWDKFVAERGGKEAE